MGLIPFLSPSRLSNRMKRSSENSENVSTENKKKLVSIRERFRYFKQKKEQPSFSSLQNGLILSTRESTPSKISNADFRLYELSTGAYLARQYLSNTFIAKLAEAALFEFPRWDVNLQGLCVGFCRLFVGFSVSTKTYQNYLRNLQIYRSLQVFVGFFVGFGTRFYGFPCYLLNCFSKEE